MEYVISEGKDLELFAQIIWTLWYRRNILRTTNRLNRIYQVIPDVIAANENYLELCLLSFLSSKLGSAKGQVETSYRQSF